MGGDERASLLQPRGACVCVEDLGYAREAKGGMSMELSGVNFVAQPGEVWFCMGRSGPWMRGARVDNERRRNEGKVCGRILYDGNLASPKWRHLITLVSRENQFNCISTLTVREIVATSARLRHADGHEQMADEIIDLLGLTKCAHVRIGSETVRGISGGEKKRVAVALGLIAHPRVVLLDEPTTGLDSTTALDVMRHVHDSVAQKQGRTVISTLHMPSADVFQKCDNVLLVRDGLTVYAGPAAKAVAFFAGSPHDCAPAPRENPADFLLAVAAAERSALGGVASKLAGAFSASAAGAAAAGAVQRAVSVPSATLPGLTTSDADQYRQVWALVWRSMTQFKRSTSIWKTSLFKMAWIGFLYSSTFVSQPLTSTGAANLESCYYFSLMFGILGNLRGIVTLFDERALFEHERASRAYGPLVYWVATTIAPLPWLVFVNVLFSTVVFFSVGSGKVAGAAWVFFWYLLVTQLTNLVGFAWAQMLAAWTSSSQVAMSVWQPGVYIWSQTSGYPIKLPHDILSTFGYPTDTPIVYYLIPLVAFIVVVRAVTFPPLREKPRTLQAVTPEQLAKAATVDAQAAVAVDLKDHLHSETSSVMSMKQGDPVEVVVRDVYYSVRVTDSKGKPMVKPLLRGVSAAVSPGETLAVMGPSGAGKSTFLDLISGRKTETVRIAALLRLSKPNDSAVGDRVLSILQMLALDGSSHVLVKALATGERRLAAVAVEMVHLPAVMYLDEPTSGLDSKMSLDFVNAMRRLAARDATLLCTIHQPTEEIFNLFDKILVAGDRNAAEYLMDIAKQGAGPMEANPGLAAPVPEGFDYDAMLTQASASYGNIFSMTYIMKQFFHFKVHCLRNALVLSHTRQALKIAMIRNLQFITMSNLQAIPQMFDERALYYREVSSGFYAELPYLAARCAINAVVQVPLVFVYSVITYPMVGLRGGVFSGYFVFFFLVMFGLSLCGYAFSNLIAAITPNQQSALNLYSALFQFCIFFCGYSIPVNQVFVFHCLALLAMKFVSFQRT
ncbi:hypothetical protein JL720_215 [Aureococcus anophagefferens]|nr:hypothetical protein JL720_215 [Aureococcus anophagefferens]